VGVNVAFNYVTTGKADLGGALKESAIGILNPAKTIAKAGKLAMALRKVEKRAEKLMPPCPVRCFAPGTQILSGEGFVAIETLKVGDLVWAHDPDTGETALKPILHTSINTQDSIWNLQLQKDGVPYLHEVTGTHPYYVDAKGGWVEVAHLQVGDVLTAADGSPAYVMSLHDTGNVITTYNFEVADINTYYVSAAMVLVHNCGSGADFIVSPDGAVARNSTEKVRESLEKAGFSGRAVQNPSGTEAGAIYNISDMKMDLRVMDGGPHHPPRVVASRQGTSQPVNPANGRNLGNLPAKAQRARSHIVLER
jgi:hypothetical protein